MKTALIENLNWRYATKKFDSTKKIPESDLNELKEVLRLSPSSFGLQPWKFVIVSDAATRKKLIEHSWGQPQITDASHLIVLCARTDVNEKLIKRFIDDTAKTRKIPAESLKQYEDMMIGFRKKMNDAETLAWSRNQVFIALGFLLSAAASKRIDACPMEGFDAAKYDEILGLKKENLASVVICPVGYRAKDDKNGELAKVRFAEKEVFVKR